MHGNVRNGTGHGNDCRMTGRFPRQGIMYGPDIGRTDMPGNRRDFHVRHITSVLLGSCS